MKFSDLKIYKDSAGLLVRITLPNLNGISIATGKGVYSVANTADFEIAPLYDNNLMWIDSWKDEVRGCVTAQEIDQIIDKMYNSTNEEYRCFLESFKFKY